MASVADRAGGETAHLAVIERSSWPVPDDFAAPPSPADRARWAEADREARPRRLTALREVMARNGVDGYFGLRWEHMRYLTGLPFDEAEVANAGDSGKFLVTMDKVFVLADSRYTIAVHREAPGTEVFECYYALPERWPELMATAGVHRVAVEAMALPHLTWERLEAAVPTIGLVPVEGWVEDLRQHKDPAEIERVAAACTLADRALAGLLPSIKPGLTELSLALDLEWRIRTAGADRLAFDVTCLAGPEAALPHGTPGERPVRDGAVLLFDFGAQVDGYRSDMTRTLFVGEPASRDLAIYELVAASQEIVFDRLAEAIPMAQRGIALPLGPDLDLLARKVIEADGRWAPYGHGLGHGIGIATHELPSVSRRGASVELPRRTVFSVEPGIYLEGETGVRIEDLVAIDADAGSMDILTRFPRDVVIVGR